MSKEKQETGYVYILTNPSFREDWVKIGKSSGHSSGHRDRYVGSLFVANQWYLSL